MTNIILSAQGTVGDLILILRLGNILKSCGHAATLITHAAYEKMVRQAGLEFVASGTQQDFERYLQDISLCETPRGNIEFQKRHVLPLAEREAALIAEQCTSPNTVLIGTHMLMLGPQLAAEKMGLPVIRLFPGAVNVARFFMFEMMYRDVLASDINALRNKIGLPNVADWAAFARFPQRNIGAWPAWFAAPEPEWPQDLGLILPGFLTMDSLEEGDIPAALEDFLQAGPPPVLIAGSTGTYLNKRFYSACVDGCRLANRRAVLVTRFPELVPDPLPEQIKWLPSLPFASVMPRMAAVIHHGGLGTLARSMRATMPQLILAAGADRPDNAQRAQNLGIGEYLPSAHWQPERIAESLNRLIDSSTVQARCHEMAHRIGADNQTTVIKNLVEELR